jgi:GntR family transcriptional regulator/MocR family aminotransferase
MFLQFDGNGVLYAQLARALKRAILHGQLKPGAALPATRVLAAELGLSRNTVLTAYETLCAEQLAVARVGSGTFVATSAVLGDRPSIKAQVPAQTRYAARLRGLPALTLRRVAHRLRYDLHYGEPLVDPPLLTAWRRELSQAAGATDWGYPPSIGLRVLRQAISEYLARRRGVVCDADDVVVVSGTQQAVSLLARVLIDEGSVVAIEDPGYELASRALQAHGARLLPVKVDAEGLRVEVLPRGSGVRMVLVTPSHQFPSGAVMSLARRTALLEYAAQRGCWVIEDDYDGEFRYQGRPIAALAGMDVDGNVIYCGTFAKTLFPSFRLGYLAVPRGSASVLAHGKWLCDLGSSMLLQQTLAGLMATGEYDRHIRRMQKRYRLRRQVLLDAFKQKLGADVDVKGDAAGLHVVAWLPRLPVERMPSLIAECARRGVGMYSIAAHAAGTFSQAGLLVGYGLTDPDAIKRGIALVSGAYRAVAGSVPTRRRR